MASPDVIITRASCSMCGIQYPKRKGNFYPSHAMQYKGIGYLTICKGCADSLFGKYLDQCGNTQDALRQMCRKLDLFWSEQLFDSVDGKYGVKAILGQYIAKTNTTTYAGRCYDDTLVDENGLWNFISNITEEVVKEQDEDVDDSDDDEPYYSEQKDIEITDEIVSRWGYGRTKSDYVELEKWRDYYLSGFEDQEDIDNATWVIIRHICNLELTVVRDSAAGKPIDKTVSSISQLLAKIGWNPNEVKPGESDEELAKVPLGVWLYKWEKQRPLPPTPEEQKDKNHIKKYIFTWMGHLGKMLSVKGMYKKLYEEEIERLRVEKPEFNGDEEDLLIDSFEDDDFDEE